MRPVGSSARTPHDNGWLEMVNVAALLRGSIQCQERLVCKWFFHGASGNSSSWGNRARPHLPDSLPPHLAPMQERYSVFERSVGYGPTRSVSCADSVSTLDPTTSGS